MPLISPVRVPADPHNYSSRRGTRVDTLIIHTVEGSLESCARWFADADAEASAHYGIGDGGEVLRFVDEIHNAWHAGNGLYNRRSIGIELEGHAAEDFLTPLMWEALIALSCDIVTRYQIPIDAEHIIGHCHVPHPRIPGRFGGLNGKVDPGRFFPWDKFRMELSVTL